MDRRRRETIEEVSADTQQDSEGLNRFAGKFTLPMFRRMSAGSSECLKQCITHLNQITPYCETLCEFPVREVLCSVHAIHSMKPSELMRPLPFIQYSIPEFLKFLSNIFGHCPPSSR